MLLILGLAIRTSTFMLARNGFRDFFLGNGANFSLRADTISLAETLRLATLFTARIFNEGDKGNRL